MSNPPDLMTFEELKALDDLVELQIDQAIEAKHETHEVEVNPDLPDVE